MKKVFLSITVLLLCVGVSMAQGRKHKKDKASNETPATVATAPVTTAAASTLKADDMSFTSPVHDFGTVIEGPDANCEFTFTNTGKEPIIIQKAQPSCGCTVPSFSGAPVAPGQTGTITVVSNAGTKVLTIKGTVEKAPTGSAPENTSMIKTN